MRTPSENLLSFDEALAQYRLLADRANKRLAALEKAGMTRGSAYRSGVRAAAAMREGAKRFTLATPKSGRVLKARLNAVRGFLSDTTSTPTGVRAVAAKTAKTIKQRYKLDLKPEQIKSIFESALWEKLDSQYGSDTAVKIMASIQKSKGDVTRTMKSLGAKHKYFSDTEKDSLKQDIFTFVNADTEEAKNIQAIFDN